MYQQRRGRRRTYTRFKRRRPYGRIKGIDYRKPKYLTVPKSVRRGAEKKYVDYSISLATQMFDVNGDVTAVNLVRQGNSVNQRIGNNIKMADVMFRGTISPSATGVGGTCRLMLIYDRQTNGALPAISTILSDSDQGGATNTGVNSGRNMSYVTRYITIYDKIFSVDKYDSVNAMGGDCYKTIKFSKKMKKDGVDVRYMGASAPAVIADLATGSLLLVSIGNTTTFGINGTLRMRFYDY